MFDFPKQAELNRLLPRSKVYEFAKPSRAVRDRFVRQIGEIVWKYKLSPETINLKAADATLLTTDRDFSHLKAPDWPVQFFDAASFSGTR